MLAQNRAFGHFEVTSPTRRSGQHRIMNGKSASIPDPGIVSGLRVTRPEHSSPRALQCHSKEQHGPEGMSGGYQRDGSDDLATEVLEVREEGASETVRFEVSMSVLGYAGLSGEFVLEPGPVEVIAGSSSGDIRSSAKFTVTGKTRSISGEDRAFLSVATTSSPGSLAGVTLKPGRRRT